MAEETDRVPPDKNVHWLAGALNRNWLFAERLIGEIEDIETDSNVLLVQLREDMTALGAPMKRESEIRAALKGIRDAAEVMRACSADLTGIAREEFDQVKGVYEGDCNET